MSKKQNKKFEIDLFDDVANIFLKDREFTDQIIHNYLSPAITPIANLFRGRLLECGCGVGYFGKFFLKQFKDLMVTGVDISSRMVELAHDPKEKYTAITADLENKKIFSNNTFNVALCPGVLHHFPDIDTVFKNITFWLDKNGILIIIEPNGSSPVNWASKLLRDFISVFLGEDWVFRKKLATPNETDHSISTYMNYLKSYDYEILVYKTMIFRSAPAWNLLTVKQLLYWFIFLFTKGTKFGGSSVLIIAQKR
jgi:ubiquinone/menaquinone biosynthesis C-methylase UbiE